MNYFSFHTLHKRHASGFVLLIGLAITAFVSWIVFLGAGPRLEKGLRESRIDLYCLAAFLFFVVAAVVFYLRRRVHILIDDDENYRMTVYVKDRAAGNVEVHYPYILRKQSCYARGPKGIKMPLLFVTFCTPEGEPLLTFQSVKSALSDLPADYEYLDLLLDLQFLDRKGGSDGDRLCYAPGRIYETAKTEDIARVVDDFLINLAKRQK